MRIRDGSEACTVGFLPRNLVRSSKEKFEGKFAQIIELYESSECAIKRRKSQRNRRMASFRLLSEIPESDYRIWLGIRLCVVLDPMCAFVNYRYSFVVICNQHSWSKLQEQPGPILVA